MPLPDEIRRYSFYAVGGLTFLCLTSFIFYNNYQLFEPHFQVLFWSICTSIILSKIKQPIKYLLINLNFKIKIFFNISLWINYFYFLFYFIFNWSKIDLTERLLIIILFLIIAVILLFPFLTSYDVLSTVFTIILTFIVIIGLTLLIARTGYLESKIASNMVMEFIDKNRDTYLHLIQNKNILQNPGNETNSVTIWRAGENYCNGIMGILLKYSDVTKNIINIPVLQDDNLKNEFCKNQINYLQENIYNFINYILNFVTSNIGIFGNTLQSLFEITLNLIYNLKNFIVSFFIYILFVFYFVKNDEYFIEKVKDFSPFTKEESEMILKKMDLNILGTFNYALLFAFCNFLMTSFSFYFVGFEVIFIFGFISAFLSIVPVISNWIIWLPATIYIISRDGWFNINWLIILLSHLSLYFIDGLIYKNFFKNQNPTLLGVSILLGVYVWSYSGIIKGPLFITLGLTLFNMIMSFNEEEQKQQSNSPSTTNLNRINRRHERGRSFYDLLSGFLQRDDDNTKVEMSITEKPSGTTETVITTEKLKPKSEQE
ncbi:hypothetical protein ABK040_009549 [Willaertia magna]